MFFGLKPASDLVATANSVFGHIPAHWGVRTMRSLIKSRSERDRTDLPLLSVARERGVFVRATDDDNHNAIPDDLTNYKLARKGDLVINKMKAWQGSLGLAPEDGIVSPAYYVYDFAVENRYFGQALLRSRPYVALLGAASDGVRIGQWDLSVPRFRAIPVLLPPADEQDKIVKYLGHAHARIDRTIAAKRKLIALLEEQKQAIIQQAVTRGLNSSVSLKDSGAPWLGHAPAHWELLPVRRHWSVTDCKHLTVPFTDTGIPLASVRQAQRFELSLSDARHTSQEHYETLIEGGRKPRPGDLIYCRNVGVGKATIVGNVGEFAMGQDVALLRSSGQDSRFFNYFLRSRAMESQLERVLVGSTFRRINVEQIRALLVATPPIEEQVEIARYLDTELAGLSSVGATVAREIELIREFRIRLTSDVVTGQVDVREIVATLPDLTDEVSFDVDIECADDDQQTESELESAGADE